MITNAAPRPWHPGMPVKLHGLSTDTKPTEWEGSPVANGSTFNEMDKDAKYKFDAKNQKWNKWTQDGGGSGGGGGSGTIAPDSDVDDALDTVFPD